MDSWDVILKYTLYLLIYKLCQVSSSSGVGCHKQTGPCWDGALLTPVLDVFL